MKISVKKAINISLLIITLVLGYITFVIKATAQNLNHQLMFIEKQVKQEHQQINLLKTEFAYLTNTRRINTLVSRYLNLNNIKISQLQDTIIKDSLLKNDLGKDNKIKWRYKNFAIRYLNNINNLNNIDNKNIFILAKN